MSALQQSFRGPLAKAGARVPSNRRCSSWGDAWAKLGWYAPCAQGSTLALPALQASCAAKPKLQMEWSLQIRGLAVLAWKKTSDRSPGQRRPTHSTVRNSQRDRQRVHPRRFMNTYWRHATGIITLRPRVLSYTCQGMFLEVQ